MDRAIILAGGFGTRLQTVVSDRPKALALVSGKPFIEYQLEWLLNQGITQVTLAVHYMADQLQEFVEQWPSDKIKIDMVYEEEPLGTGGAVTNVIQQKNMTGKVLVINGDTLFNFSLQSAIISMKKRDKPVILLASKLDNVSRFGTIKLQDDYVLSFNQATGVDEEGIVNSGAYLMDSTLFSNKKIETFSLEYDLFPKLVKERKLIAYTVNDSEGFFDIGTPESYKEICANDV